MEHSHHKYAAAREPHGPFPGIDPEFGLSNMQPQFFFTPVGSGSFSWAVGPALWLPTATDKTLGINKWGGGPVVVAPTTQGPLLAGFLAQNIWAGDQSSLPGQRVNALTIMPFVFYNMPGGWFVTYRPLITADWTVDKRRWTVPIGGGFGRVFPVGDVVIDVHVQAFYNGLTPPAAGMTNVGKWTAMLVVHFLSPESSSFSFLKLETRTSLQATGRPQTYRRQADALGDLRRDGDITLYASAVIVKDKNGYELEQSSSRSTSNAE